MPSGGAREAMLTTDYNAEMIEHIERHPKVRDRAIFVGDLADMFPTRSERICRGCESGCQSISISQDMSLANTRECSEPSRVKAGLGYSAGEKVCIVTVGGLRRGGRPLNTKSSWILAGGSIVIPGLRMIVVAGPRIDPQGLDIPNGVEVAAFVPNLDHHLAACDLALVQGGLSTCMELTAAGTPFIYFPLQNHFEQNFHVAYRLDRYRAGKRMQFVELDAGADRARDHRGITRTGTI